MSSQHQSYQVMPELDDETFERLKEDIREHGIEYPIIENADGEIIDGHHRLRAWTDLGRDPDDIPRRVIEDSEEENYHRAYRTNLLRRELDGVKQRVVKQYFLENKERVVAIRDSNDEDTQKAAASDLGVSEWLVSEVLSDDDFNQLGPKSLKTSEKKQILKDYLDDNPNASSVQAANDLESAIGVSHVTVSKWRKEWQKDPEPAKVDTFANDGREANKVREVARRAREGDQTAVEEAERITKNETTPEKAYRKVSKESNRKKREEKREEQKERVRQSILPDDAPRPTLEVADSGDLPLSDGSVDLIITSPPYNLGHDKWRMGGEDRTEREEGIGYTDEMREDDYQQWQLAVFNELYRVATDGASFFYNHKVRQVRGEIIHPMDWLRSDDNPWTVRQEIVWDRTSTHNHSPQIFWPHDERIYWMTKGDPALPEDGVGMPSVWKFHGPRPNTDHPAPFPDELPRRCIEAVACDGDVILDPFGGSMTTCEVAAKLGHESIGVDVNEEYVETARRKFE